MRVQDEEPGHRAADLDGHDGVIGAAANSLEDFTYRAQEALGLVGIEFDSLQRAVFVAAQSSECGEHHAPSD